MKCFRLFLVILAIAILPGCTLGYPDTKTPAPEKQKTAIRLTEAVRSIYYTPQYLATSLGFFEEEKLEIRLDTAWGGDRALEKLQRGETDIILAGPDLVFAARRQQSQPTATPLVFAQLTRRDGSFLIGRQADPDFSWQKLKGKIIITSRRGSMPEMSLLWLLQQQGLKPYHELTPIQNIPPELVEGAFISGSGHYLQAFEPLASRLEQTGKGQVVAALGQVQPELPFAVYLILPGTIQEKAETVRAFVRAIARAQSWLLAHTPAETAAQIKPFFPDHTQAELEQMLKRYYQVGVWPQNPIPDPAAFTNLQEMMISTGNLVKPLPLAEIINPEIARAALKTAVPQ